MLKVTWKASPQTKGILGKEGSDMVRMVKRLLRGGNNHRVTGLWVW